MHSIRLALLILALAQAQAFEDNQESNDIYAIKWPIDILKREVYYRLIYEVDEHLKWIHNEDSRDQIRNYVVRDLRQCIDGSHNEQSNCVTRATYSYRQFAGSL